MINHRDSRSTDLRLDRLKKRRDSAVFSDKWGPGLLAFGLFAVRAYDRYIS